MRDNSSSMADGVILVIAANEGIVSTQTKDIFQYISEYHLPCVVALNKMDLALPNIKDYIRSQLFEYHLNPPIVETCALLRNTLDPLLIEVNKMIKKINPLGYFNGLAEGSVLESYHSVGEGIVLRVLIRRGILNNHDTFICGLRTGKIKMIKTMDNEIVNTAVPGQVVDVIGLKRPEKALRATIPPLGDTLFCRSTNQINDILNLRLLEIEMKSRIIDNEEVELPYIDDGKDEGEKRKVCIVKAETTGSLASLVDNLQKCNVDVIQAGVGKVLEKDISFGLLHNATILALDVKIKKEAMTLARNSHVKILQSRIAHCLIEEFTGVKVYHSNDVRKHNL